MNSSAAMTELFAPALLELIAEAAQFASRRDIMEFLLGAAMALGRGDGLSDSEILAVLQNGLAAIPRD